MFNSSICLLTAGSPCWCWAAINTSLIRRLWYCSSIEWSITFCLCRSKGHLTDGRNSEGNLEQNGDDVSSNKCLKTWLSILVLTHLLVGSFQLMVDVDEVVHNPLPSFRYYRRENSVFWRKFPLLLPIKARSPCLNPSLTGILYRWTK